MKRIVIILSLFSLFCLWPQLVSAMDENPFAERTVEDALISPTPPNDNAESPANTAPVGSSNGSLLTALLNMLAALALVLALIYIIYRIFFRRQSLFRQVGGIRYLGAYPLGQQKSIQLLEIAGKVYVLGVADEVRLLRLIDDPNEAEKVITDMTKDANLMRSATQMTEQFQERIDELKQQRRLWLNRIRRQQDAGDGEGRG